MASPSNDNERNDWGDDKYTPDQDRTLSEAILEAIEDYKDIELTEADFTLYDHIDPTSLDTLFRHDAEPNAIVMFSVDDVRVHLWGDSGVEIRVTDRPDDEPFPPETA